MWSSATLFLLALLACNTSAQLDLEDVYGVNTQGNIFPWVSRFYPEEKRSSSDKLKSIKARFRGSVKDTFFG